MKLINMLEFGPGGGIVHSNGIAYFKSNSSSVFAPLFKHHRLLLAPSLILLHRLLSWNMSGITGFLDVSE